ncbi:hypothetical protein L202_05777 [Cryptococcus amylolentus CBS 6039]|uniref:C3H1-type domain-containing protein n=2 Tax=Cryptococcus amylolentus TaxID=104669 RepID=A0A1E3HHE5_9TREE|nr:hypothetical protein L202_05777 [Cryptococcus amylolentus CBS 6039]ODN75768.1 hypothetical protein L202_05777 [Cryptococcus amylolentus CBS 6039]ODN96938.1 hypothetical protein I350_07913 [Cryptococcus amylolentus CBS 6273]
MGDNSTIRAPSPRKGSIYSITQADFDPPTAPTPTPTATTNVLSAHPHLGHYIFSLLNKAYFPPPRSAVGDGKPEKEKEKHPLSHSSGGSDDGSDDGANASADMDNEDGDVSQSESEAASQTSTATKSSEEGGSKKATSAEKEELVKRIVDLLDNEQEDELKVVLKPYMGELGKDDILMEQVCLDCMHKRKDDMENLPYAPHLTPTRNRGGPTISRPFTPSRVPSFRARTPLSRAHSPVLPAGSLKGLSPAPSPLASPRLLNAKASQFNPSARSVSGPGAMNVEAKGFIPSDAWKDAPDTPPRVGSPFGAIGGSGMTRTASNLAIAAPLFGGKGSPFHSPVGTPQLTPVKMPDLFGTASPALSLRSRGVVPDDDDDDEFSPFGSGLPKLHHQENALKPDSKPFNPYFPPTSYLSSDYTPGYPSSAYSDTSFNSAEFGEENGEDVSGAGMTPLDVLCSVFTSVPRNELEDALHRAGYDFEAAMSMLVSQYTAPRSGQSTPQRVSSPRPMGMGRGGRDGFYPNLPSRTLRSMSPMGPRSPAAGGGGGKMCRYFLAGECRRSDCRFSHDLDRAMCRFWLRGHCAKGPNCEFLHQFPNNLDVSALQTSLQRVEMNDYARPDSPGYGQGHLHHQQAPDEFPDLNSSRMTRAPRFDPSRNRFANALKRAAPVMPRDHATAPPPPAPSSVYSDDSAGVAIVPKASSRVALRKPVLLPTLPTGTVANEAYLSSRAGSIRLGHARNACLARAADAFRRGDGGAAKRFSREGKALNQRMLNEQAEAAQELVRVRTALAREAIMARPLSWSTDPADARERGKPCGGGLGVVLGVASVASLAGNAGRSKGGAGKGGLEEGERVECVLDLHTLHGQEGVEICGQFLAELERERFRGLAYIVIGSEKHVGTQDPNRGASKTRLGTSVMQALVQWGYAWSEDAGIICCDPCRN